MLKLTYMESGLQLAYLDSAVETFVAQRVIWALRVGAELQIAPGWAALLLPTQLPGLTQFKVKLQGVNPTAIALASVDADYLEVTLRGTWLAMDHTAHEGIFITQMPKVLETNLDQFWQATQTCLRCS